VKLFSKNSSTNATDEQTDGRTDGETTYYKNTALCIASRGYKWLRSHNKWNSLHASHIVTAFGPISSCSGAIIYH